MENKRKNGSNTTQKQKMNMRDSANRASLKNSYDARSSSSKNNGASFGTRRVSKPSNSKKYRDRDIAREAQRLRQGMSEAEKRREIERNRKQERLKRQRLQALIWLVLAAVFTVVFLFMTPIFNIKEVRLTGNNTVHKEVINEKIGYVVGANLFGTSSSKIERKMCEIPQISDVEVRKHVFPAYLELFITESTPAAYLLAGSSTIVIDSDLKVIDDADVFNKDKLPSISGVSVESYQLNLPLDFKSDEKREVLITLLKSLETMGHISKVSYISVDDLTSIKFNYDNRIEVHCGSQLELDRKIRMFSEVIKTSTIKDNSMGVIDVSIPGKTSYES